MYDLIGNFIDSLSTLLNLEMKHVALLIIVLSSLFHYNTYKNWNDAIREKKYYAKLHLMVLVTYLNCLYC